MSALLSLLIIQQCHKDNLCIKYMTGCTQNLLKEWKVDKLPEYDSRVKVAISVCEKKYDKDIEAE